MAFSVSGLSDYTKEEKTEMLAKALFEGKTATLMAANIIPNIKSAEKLPILESTIYMQADGCGYTTSGTTAFTQRTLTVGKVKIEETLCPKTLNTKYLQKSLAAGSEIDLGIFTSQIGTEKAANIADLTEIALWQGDLGSGNPNLNKWDGFYTILAALGYGGNGDPVEGNPTTGGGWTQQTTMTVSNIHTCLDKVWAQVPERVKGSLNSNIVCFLSITQFDNALAYLAGANLYHYNPEDNTNMSIVWRGTRMKLQAVPGLTALNVLIAGDISNFYIGTDLANEEEDYKMWYSEDNDEVRFRCTFKYGTQVAFPAQTVLFEI